MHGEHARVKLLRVLQTMEPGRIGTLLVWDLKCPSPRGSESTRIPRRALAEVAWGVGRWLTFVWRGWAGARRRAPESWATGMHPAAMYSTMPMPKCSSVIVCRPTAASPSARVTASNGALTRNSTSPEMPRVCASARSASARMRSASWRQPPMTASLRGGANASRSCSRRFTSASARS